VITSRAMWQRSPSAFYEVAGAVACALTVVVLPGCGKQAFDGHVFQNGELSFRVAEVPSSWQRLDAEGALLAFRDPATPATIAVSGRCGSDGDDVPLESLTHHLFIEFTERTVESQVRVELDGREALHTEMLAKLDGVSKRFTVFVFKKNGCVYDFMHIAPPSAPADGRREFVSFVQGFSTINP
jgi:hypothetical protein